MKVAVVGGGAAGFFAAISVVKHHPKAKVTLYEKTNKLLSKVRVSGGGRCNVTNGSKSIKEISSGYPRGAKAMKKLLGIFNTSHTMDWYESRGVKLKVESDGRVFPVSNKSQSIIDCLMQETQKKGITVVTKCDIKSIVAKDNSLTLQISNGKKFLYDKVIIATGGSPKRSGLEWIESLGHHIEEPVPSLFTFNMPSNKITALMGVVAENVSISIQGTKLKSSGSLLITHWGMSGPAILKLSAFGARILNDLNYNFRIQINWVNVQNSEIIMQQLNEIIKVHPRKKLTSIKPYNLSERLWIYLLLKGGLQDDKRWDELGKRGLNKLIDTLSHDVYTIKGKTTFKEEFVTCGGVSLKSIDMNTLKSKVCPNIFFAGEVMDIDGITGGYNFQAAWATGYVAGMCGVPHSK